MVVASCIKVAAGLVYAGLLTLAVEQTGAAPPAANPQGAQAGGETLEAPADLMGLSPEAIFDKARTAVAQFDAKRTDSDPTLEWCRKLRGYAKHIGKPDQAATARFEAIQLAYDHGYVKEAVAYFREAAENHPEHRDAELWIKRLVDEALNASPDVVGDLRDTLTVLQRSKTRQTAAAAWYYLGELQAESGDAEGARRSFQRLGSSFRSTEYEPLASQALVALTSLREGRPAPAVQCKDMNGGAIDLAGERDKRPVVIYFWDPQGSDQQFLIDLRRLARDIGDQVAFIGVPRNGTKESLQEFFADMPLPGVTADPAQTNDISQSYAVRRTPHVALIDKAGKIKTCAAPQSFDFESAVLRLCGLLAPELVGLDKMIADYDQKVLAFNRGGRQGRHPAEDDLPRFQQELQKPTLSGPDRDKLFNTAFGALIDVDQATQFQQFYSAILQQTKEAPVLGRFAAAYRDASEAQGSSDWLAQLQDLGSSSQNPGVAAAAKLAIAESYVQQNKTEEAEKLLNEIKTTYAGTREAAAADGDLRELKSLAVGMPAPDFATATIDGASLKLSELKGHLVILSFASVPSSPAMKNVDRLKTLATTFPNARLVTVWSDPDSTWVKRLGLPWQQVLNTSNADVAKLYNVGDPPRVFVIDQQGTIRAKSSGVNADLEKTVKTLLQTAAK